MRYHLKKGWLTKLFVQLCISLRFGKHKILTTFFERRETMTQKEEIIACPPLEMETFLQCDDKTIEDGTKYGCMRTYVNRSSSI